LNLKIYEKYPVHQPDAIIALDTHTQEEKIFLSRIEAAIEFGTTPKAIADYIHRSALLNKHIKLSYRRIQDGIGQPTE